MDRRVNKTTVTTNITIMSTATIIRRKMAVSAVVAPVETTSMNLLLVEVEVEVDETACVVPTPSLSLAPMVATIRVAVDQVRLLIKTRPILAHRILNSRTSRVEVAATPSRCKVVTTSAAVLTVAALIVVITTSKITLAEYPPLTVATPWRKVTTHSRVLTRPSHGSI